MPETIDRVGHAVAARVLTFGSRIKTFSNRHPVVVDGGLVALLLLVVAIRPPSDAAKFADMRPPAQVAPLISVAMVMAATVPLVLRRRYPRGVFVAIAIATTIQAVFGSWTNGDIPLLIALYGIALGQSFSWMLAAVAAAEAVVAVRVLRWALRDGVEIFLLLSAMTVAAASIGLAVRSRRRYIASLHDRAERIARERASDTALAVAAERATIAREVHDVIAHNLSVMVALADGAAYAYEKNPTTVRTALDSLAVTGRSAVAELQRLLSASGDHIDTAHLSPQPGLDDLTTMVDRVRSAGLPVRLTVGGSVGDTSPGTQLDIYRIVQEALTNALKHSVIDGSASAQVILERTDDRIDIIVINSGTTTDRAPGTSRGIIGMRERAARYHATLHAGPIPGGRWQVRTRLYIGDEEVAS
ncbi:sensor histidine kinase [Nocardia sp. NPDC003183]